MNGTTILLLTTTDHHSGEPRRTALIYREIDGEYVVVASNPEVQLQVLMTEPWPDYDNYETKTNRQIPIVVITRT